MLTYITLPYAALAIVRHEFDAGNLHIWLTFPHPMNQAVKPDDSKWRLFYGFLEWDIDSSAWVDEYTLLLEASGLEMPPARVLISYDGPGPETWSAADPARKTLETTWHKQWEPFSPILSLDITT